LDIADGLLPITSVSDQLQFRHMNKVSGNPILRFSVSGLTVCAIVVVYFRWLHVNPTTVGFTFLLFILVISTLWGLRYALFTAILSTVAYNYFFLPPLLHLSIADPQDWVALFAFLFTAVVASQLSDRARREAELSTQRRREVELLYAYSQQLLVTDNVFELLNAIPKYIVDSFGVKSAAMLLDEKRKTYYLDGAGQSTFPPEQLQAISGRGEPVLDREHSICYMPLRMGIRTVGSLGLSGCTLSRATLEAVGSLTATAIERAKTIEKLSKAEAAREGDRLRSVLLDSVTHEFRTPLTAIKASAETLLSDIALDAAQRKELLTVIDEESDRLNRLVGEVAEVAQLDSHQMELNFQSHDIREVVDAAIRDSRHALQNHSVMVDVPDNLPPVRIDIVRIAEVLTQLLDNAGKYSPNETAIHVTVERRKGELITSVADHGPGIDPFEQEMIFEKFYRGKVQRTAVQGTGMGLAISKAIVELHGGKIGVTSQLARGSVFWFSLPTS
jgi:two-component system, OmpR family, sensor histidine kinase KdpD